MLAIISDLHFSDNTASLRKVDPRAFGLALDDIYQSAAQLATKIKPTHLYLVFLGDVFDFLRTTYWFGVPIAERPWGSADALRNTPASPATIAHAHKILDAILDYNQDALATLRGEGRRVPDDVVVHRIYFPGNHDRLYLHDAALRDRCRAALALSNEAIPGVFTHHIEMPEYGLLARHGHEWDEFNFEAYTGEPPVNYTDTDYLATPIGDPITTELVARLPYELGRNLVGSSLTAAEQQDAVSRLQSIEDVRPLFASFHWVHYEVNRIHDGYIDAQKQADLTAALNTTVRTLARDFRELEFYQEWKHKHHRFLHLDSAEEMAAVLDALSVISIGTIGAIAQMFERFAGSSEPRDNCRNGAAKEDLRAVATAGLRFVVYGHTHEPLQVAMHADGTEQDLYINSGTFRSAIFRTDDQSGFIGWDRMTYLSFFSQAEMTAFDNRTPHAGPGFDSWTGNRNR